MANVVSQNSDTVNRNQGFPNYQYSFTGSDYEVIYISHNSEGLSRLLSSLQTLSFSMHSELYPARRLGEKAAHGYARGVRTVAGTMIFLFMGNDPFIQEVAMSQELINAEGAYEARRCHIEMIPEFDLIIKAKAEVPIFDKDGAAIAQNTQMFIGGVSLAESGSTLSTHDVYTEIMYTFVAKYYVPFLSSVPLDVIRGLSQPDNVASSVGSLMEEYADTIKAFSIRRGKMQL